MDESRVNDYFRSYLRGSDAGSAEAEAMWDGKAESFSRAQLAERSGFPRKVTQLLAANGLLAGYDVIDIGGGSGRYAIPFSEHARSVTVTDISSGMLEHAHRNAQEAGRDNLRFVKLDWAALAIEGSEYEKAFDVAFAAMCPAVRSESGLIKMMKAARVGCAVNQFIRTRDSLSDYLRAANAADDASAAGPDSAARRDPHNDRDSVRAIFHLLWGLGYDVQIAHHYYKEHVEYTLESAAARFGGTFGGRSFRVDGRGGLTLEQTLELAAPQGMLRVDHDTALTTIYWKL